MIAGMRDRATVVDPLVIAGRTLDSRLLLGSGGFSSLTLMSGAIKASCCRLVTVALRRAPVPISLIATGKSTRR